MAVLAEGRAGEQLLGLLLPCLAAVGGQHMRRLGAQLHQEGGKSKA